MTRFLNQAVICLLILSVAAIAVLPGCAPSTPVKKVTLQFWTHLPNNQQIEQLVKDFNARNPSIEVIHQGLTPSSYTARLNLATAPTSSADTARPDIVGIDVMLMPDIVGKSVLLPLDDMLKLAGEGFTRDFGEGLFYSNRYQGKTYGVPWWTAPSLMIYNKTVLEKAGVTRVPETYDELMLAAKAITKGTGDPATAVYGAIFPITAPGVLLGWLPYLWGAGGDLLDAENCAAFNNAAGEGVMRLWVEMYTQKYMPPGAITGASQGELDRLFFNERAGFIVGSYSLVEQARRANPAIQVDAALIPRPANGKHSSYLAGDNLVILKSTKYPNEAWRFIQFMLDTKNMSTLALANNAIYINGLPTRNSVLTSDFFNRFPYARTIAEAAKVGRAPNTPFLDAAGAPLYTALQDALSGKKPVKQVLAEAEAQFNKVTGCKK
jgi:ABC-type glycerol-3-phosphate transport system substrate-binding protein